jgi:predicted metal-dependent HD superfamily phosphohydrolase
MSAGALVEQRWRELAGRRGCAGPAAQRVFEELAAAYGEPHRAYHTLEHIATLLRLLDAHGDGAVDRDSLVLAILFHDAIYDPARADNEAKSADLAAARLAALGFGEETIARVRRHILATRHGAGIDAGADADAALLLDLDLSVLAAPPAAYRAYAQAIRREFAVYADDVYRPGRRRVLQGFLARERIYLTERLFALWEGPARVNLAAEVAELG